MGLLLCAPAFATDWLSILSSKNPATHPQNEQALARLESTDIPTAQAEVAELNTLYQSDPELRPMIGKVLMVAITIRSFQAAPRLDNNTDVFQPIIPTLIEHLTDPDSDTRLQVERVIASLKPQPRAEALNPLISLINSETDPGNMRIVIAAVARYCTTSQSAVAALAKAAGPDQPRVKRAIVLDTIGLDLTKCTDPALVDAVLAGLRTSDDYIVSAAAKTAALFGATEGPLMADLQRIATTGQGQSAETARETLRQLQRR